MNKNKSTNKPLVRLYVTGFFMGLADLIPGVSGGTVAFISGIYEELLSSIKKVSGETLKLGLQFKIKEAIASVPFRFLLPLFAGIFTAILTLANLLGYLLETYPSYVWSFFFGLVAASIWLVSKKIPSWNMSHMLAFGVTTIVGFLIVGAVPVETPEHLWVFFLSGMIAICAMILPGISGSFILLILGKYSQVLDAVREMNVMVLAAVVSGCVVGLAVFARFLSWLFAKHHDISVAALTGFMLGSLRKLWPWQEEVYFDGATLLVIGLMALGIGIILYIDRLNLVKEDH